MAAMLFLMRATPRDFLAMRSTANGRDREYTCRNLGRSLVHAHVHAHVSRACLPSWLVRACGPAAEGCGRQTYLCVGFAFLHKNYDLQI